MAAYLQGIVINKRRLSKRLVFIDVEISATGATAELLLKPNDSLTAAAVHDFRDSIKLGDELEVGGSHEQGGSSTVFLVSSIRTVSKWKDSHPNEHFVPRALRDEWQPEMPGSNHSNLLHQAAHSSKSPQVCKFFINAGTCTKGMACPFLHVDPASVVSARKSWIAQRLQRRRELAKDSGDPHAGSEQRKSQRAVLFAEWLVATFGKAYLNQGSGVLDIAGGQGSLSFQLQNVHGVRCTCVDPRSPCLSHAARKFLKHERKAATAISTSSNWDSSTCVGEAGLRWHFLEEEYDRHTGVPAGSHHAAMRVPVEGGTGAPEASAVELGGNPLQEGSCMGENLPGHIMAHFNQQLWHGEHAARLQAASVVVGLHPDQATDAIVEYAALHEKAFAVVPCCVFPRLFRHRQLHPEGAVVERIEDLLEYLVRMGGRGTRLERLAFEGRNQVVYRQLRS